jgi:hypothetical protein
VTPPNPRTSRRVALASSVVLQVIDGEALLLDLSREQVFALDAGGARIAELVSGGRTIADVVTTLCAEFGGPPDQIATDVDDLIAVLLERGLLIEAAGDPT